MKAHKGKLVYGDLRHLGNRLSRRTLYIQDVFYAIKWDYITAVWLIVFSCNVLTWFLTPTYVSSLNPFATSDSLALISSYFSPCQACHICERDWMRVRRREHVHQLMCWSKFGSDPVMRWKICEKLYAFQWFKGTFLLIADAANNRLPCKRVDWWLIHVSAILTRLCPCSRWVDVGMGRGALCDALISYIQGCVTQ